MHLRATRSIAAVIAIAATVPLFSSAHAASLHARAHQDFPPLPGTTPIVITIPTTSPPPSSSPGKGTASPRHSQVSATQLAADNSYVRALLKGKAYRLGVVKAWPAGHGKAVELRFYHRTTVTGTWLNANARPYRATYRNIAGIMAYVNTVHARVAAIAPIR